MRVTDRVIEEIADAQAQALLEMVLSDPTEAKEWAKSLIKDGIRNDPSWSLAQEFRTWCHP